MGMWITMKHMGIGFTVTAPSTLYRSQSFWTFPFHSLLLCRARTNFLFIQKSSSSNFNLLKGLCKFLSPSFPDKQTNKQLAQQSICCYCTTKYRSIIPETTPGSVAHGMSGQRVGDKRKVAHSSLCSRLRVTLTTSLRKTILTMLRNVMVAAGWII